MHCRSCGHGGCVYCCICPRVAHVLGVACLRHTGCHLLPEPQAPSRPAAVRFLLLPLGQAPEWESGVMCRNVTSIQMTQLKNDCVFTLNIKTCHLTEGTNDSEIQCFRLEPSRESERLSHSRHRTREWRLGARLSGSVCHSICPIVIGCSEKQSAAAPRPVRSSAVHTPCFPGK